MIKNGEDRICGVCNKVFYVPLGRQLGGRGLYCSKECRQSSPLVKQKISISRIGNKNPMWKGVSVGYIALHEWVRNRIPKPAICQRCKIAPSHDLANISQEYKRDLSDWEWLCRKCHMEKDGRLEQFIKKYAKLKTTIS